MNKQRSPKPMLLSYRRLLLLIALPFAMTSVTWAVEHATITVDNAGAATKAGGTANFFLDSGKVTGEIPIRIGTGAADDAAGGVLISVVSELDRAGVYATGSIVGDSSSNSNNTRNLTGGLSIASTKAGAESPPDAGNPIDANLSAAYFSFADGWSGGTLSSSTENANGTFGALNSLVASSNIGLSNFSLNLPNPDLDPQSPQPGVHGVTIPGVTDSNRQGILVATTASKVGRYTSVSPNLDGDGYTVRTVDNDGFFEFDPSSDPSLFGEGNAVDTPFSFVFVPVGTPGVTLARVATNGSGTSFGQQNGVGLVHSGSNFTVTSDNTLAPGRFRLEIEGVTPSDGTLIVTPIGGNEDPGSLSSDNVLTYGSDSTGWTILAQDMEADALTTGEGDVRPLNGNGQAANGASPYFNFLFIPNAGAPTSPAAIPAIETLTTFNRGRVIGWNTEVTPLSITDSNLPGGVSAEIGGSGTQQTSDVRIDIFANRGDAAVAVDGAYLTPRDGLLLTTISEDFRSNNLSGGKNSFAVSMTGTFQQQWAVSTATAQDVPQEDEFNVNYASAFFGVDSGFQMGIGVEIPGDTANPGEGVIGTPYVDAKLDVDLAGVNALTDGVLIAQGFGTGDNFATATPKADGSGWEVRTMDNNYDAGNPDSRLEPEFASWIYLPYDTENLVAGLIDSAGTVVSSTPGSGTDWTITKTVDPVLGGTVYRLSFTDPSLGPDSGMLLLTGTGDFDSTGTENIDNSLVYKADGDDFLIRGIDHVPAFSGDTLPQDTGFMFAYIDYEEVPTLTNPVLAGDYNGDGIVDAADYTVWRDNVGNASLPNNETASPGTVDQADYLAWKNNYGSSSISLSSNANSVPEPGTISIILLGIISLVPARRAGRRGAAA